MAENYFENLRIVGASLDEGLAKIEDTWKMPQLLLCKNNIEDQEAAKNYVENLRSELQTLKGSITSSKKEMNLIKQTHTQFLEDTLKDIKNLTKEVNDIKILFTENKYEEDTTECNLSLLTSQLEALTVSHNNSILKESSNTTESPSFDNSNTFYETATKEDCANLTNSETISSENVRNRILLNDLPREAYSPYYYKIMKN